jgi:hypothetical protein
MIKLSANPPVNLPLDFNNLSTNERVEKLQEWLNLCHLVKVDNCMDYEYMHNSKES